MTAFVAGATGYTGRCVVESLVAQSVRTVAHIRPDSRARDRLARHFESLGAIVDTTPWDHDAMSATLTGVKPAIVFALLGTTRARARAERSQTGQVETYDSVDYGLTALLLRATLESGARSRFVYLSAAGVREGTRNAYYAARARAERDIVESGLPYIIARPSIITGPDRDDSRPLERFAGVAADAALGAIGLVGAKRLRDRYRSTTGPALAAALVRLALSPSMESKIVESEALQALPTPAE